jgi:collagenase-like PrtC family protease
MRLSVAYGFAPGLIQRLAEFPQVHEIYGKLDRDPIGGGRSTYTLRPTSMRALHRAVTTAHDNGLAFNYLLNGATLGGMEQTRAGQRKIRRLLDTLAAYGVDSVTVASPYLLRLIKARYPRFSTRISVFAVIDTPGKAREWEAMGADTLCISAIACNRDFTALERIRRAVSCDLQLIVNASCLLDCTHELTHMNLLTQSSRTGERLGGYCLDYCFLHCSSRRLRDPVNFLKATWIRPEDLHYYESLGYDNFKIVERSCPEELLIKRVRAYAERSFEGNLLEIAGPVAQIKREQNTPLRQRIRMVTTMLRPDRIKTGALLRMKRYAEAVIPHEFSRERAPVFIDNRLLDGFLAGVRRRNCSQGCSKKCDYCARWAEKVVRIDPSYREETLGLAEHLDEGLVRSTHWL